MTTKQDVKDKINAAMQIIDGMKNQGLDRKSISTYCDQAKKELNSAKSMLDKIIP